MRFLILVSGLLLMVGCASSRKIKPMYDRSSLKRDPDFIINHMFLPDTTNFDNWGDDVESIKKRIPKSVLKTQKSYSFSQSGVKTSISTPSIIPHACLDTALKVVDKRQLKGLWGMTSGGAFFTKDSLSLPDSSITRKDSVLLVFDDDFILNFDGKRLQFLSAKKGSSKFRQMLNKKYQVVDGRYLLHYSLSKSDAGAHFIGIDTDDNLYWDHCSVEIRFKPKHYSVSKVLINRFIFKRIDEISEKE